MPSAEAFWVEIGCHMLLLNGKERSLLGLTSENAPLPSAAHFKTWLARSASLHAGWKCIHHEIFKCCTWTWAATSLNTSLGVNECKCNASMLQLTNMNISHNITQASCMEPWSGKVVFRLRKMIARSMANYYDWHKSIGSIRTSDINTCGCLVRIAADPDIAISFLLLAQAWLVFYLVLDNVPQRAPWHSKDGCGRMLERLMICSESYLACENWEFVLEDVVT